MNSELKAAVEKIYEAIQEAEETSHATGEVFSLEICYGMGGYYNPESIEEDIGSYWRPSSLNC